VGRRLGRFHVICLLGLLLGVGVLHGLHAGLGWNLHLANLAAIVAAAGWNFTLSLRYGWGVQR
jgi:putative flippase GtrA